MMMMMTMMKLCYPNHFIERGKIHQEFCHLRPKEEEREKRRLFSFTLLIHTFPTSLLLCFKSIYFLFLPFPSSSFSSSFSSSSLTIGIIYSSSLYHNQWYSVGLKVTSVLSRVDPVQNFQMHNTLWLRTGHAITCEKNCLESLGKYLLCTTVRTPKKSVPSFGSSN